MDDKESQVDLFQKIVKNNWSVRQAEEESNLLKNPKQSVSKTKAALPKHYKKAEKNLADIIEVKVEIKAAANKKKKKIVLDFKNEEELENILSHFK